MSKYISLAILFAAVVLMTLLNKTLASRNDEGNPKARNSKDSKPYTPYRQTQPLLTPTESELYVALLPALPPGMILCPKVRVADLLEVKPHIRNKRGPLNRIAQKHVDFVLCKGAAMRVLLAVELDDKSHKEPDRIERDQFLDAAFEEAKLPLLRIPAAPSYDTNELRKLVRVYLR